MEVHQKSLPGLGGDDSFHCVGNWCGHCRKKILLWHPIHCRASKKPCQWIPGPAYEVPTDPWRCWPISLAPVYFFPCITTFNRNGNGITDLFIIVIQKSNFNGGFLFCLSDGEMVGFLSPQSSWNIPCCCHRNHGLYR